MQKMAIPLPNNILESPARTISSFFWSADSFDKKKKKPSEILRKKIILPLKKKKKKKKI